MGANAAALLLDFFDSTDTGIAVVDRDLRFLMVNAALARLNRYPQEEHVGKTIDEVVPYVAPTLAPRLQRVFATGEPLSAVTVTLPPRGPGESTRYFANAYTPVRRRGSVIAVAAIITERTDEYLAEREAEAALREADLRFRQLDTQQKALETQLLLAQKLDSIGRLAGGIAHDFNGLLTVILGQVGVARRALAEGRDVADELAQVERAATHAADLTRQLLAFARRQPMHPTPLDPAEVAAGIEKMLGRVLGNGVTLVSRLDPSAGIVRADRTQIEQVLMNLAINARDAMPSGGTLTIATSGVDLGQAEAEKRDLSPGPYVVLTVSDTGNGIPVADRSQVFEPFFTTKQATGGTGLGLSTCYGIVKQHGGHVELETEVGRGTTFRVYLPRIDTRYVAAGR